MGGVDERPVIISPEGMGVRKEEEHTFASHRAQSSGEPRCPASMVSTRSCPAAAKEETREEGEYRRDQNRETHVARDCVEHRAHLLQVVTWRGLGGHGWQGWTIYIRGIIDVSAGVCLA